MDSLGTRYVRGLVAGNRHSLSRLGGSSRDQRSAHDMDRVDNNRARRISGAGNRDAPSRRTNRVRIGAARLRTISRRETIMCGRVRLSSDYSEIKIRLKFAPNSVAPNFEPDWNKPPTAPMLVAIDPLMASAYRR